jgi:hypothetical protein
LKCANFLVENLIYFTLLKNLKIVSVQQSLGDFIEFFTIPTKFHKLNFFIILLKLKTKILIIGENLEKIIFKAENFSHKKKRRGKTSKRRASKETWT